MNARLREQDLDARQAERLQITALDLRNVGERAHVTTPTGIVIGRAYTQPPAPIFSEAHRVQSLVLLAAKTDGEYTGSRWPVDIHPDDEHSRAMAETPATPRRDLRSTVWAERVILAIAIGMLFCACVSGWNAWLPGGGQ